MPGQSTKSSSRNGGKNGKGAIDRPFDPQVLRRAEKVAAQYGLLIQPDPEAGYFARVLEMPGVMADGKTPAACLNELRKAAVIAVAVMLESGQTPPAAAGEAHRNSQINIRVSAEEKLLFEEEAKRRGFRGVSDFVRTTTLSSIR